MVYQRNGAIRDMRPYANRLKRPRRRAILATNSTCRKGRGKGSGGKGGESTCRVNLAEGKEGGDPLGNGQGIWYSR